MRCRLWACPPSRYANLPSFPAPPTDGGVLAPRQAAIANLLLTDLSFSQIAAKLHISVNTVKSHVKAIYEKLGVDSRQDVARVVTTQPWLLPHGGLLDAFGAEGIPDGRPSSPATRSA